MNTEIKLNRNVEEILHDLATRSGVEEIESFAEIFGFAKRSGGDFAGIIRTTAMRISAKIEVEREVDIVIAGKKLEGKIMSVMPFLILTYLNLASKEFIDPLYGNAVLAKHQIKGRRDRHYMFYDELNHESIQENRELEDHFEMALEKEEFEIWYQPKYSAHTRKLVGAEALVRWRRQDGSLIPPLKFIPLFERNGNIIRLDEYVFRAVCRQQKAWQEQGQKMFPVSVNISRVSLYYSNVVEKYESIIRSYDLDSKYIQLEITESATIDNNEIFNLLEQFHTAGFKILLDDFGSGYSSLSTLNRMHFDTIKLDKSLVDYIGDDNGEKLLNSITKLAQSFGMEITAEGVETAEQLMFLCNLDCDDIQGYYFSRPLPVREYEECLKEACM